MMVMMMMMFDALVVALSVVPGLLCNFLLTSLWNYRGIVLFQSGRKEARRGEARRGEARWFTSTFEPHGGPLYNVFLLSIIRKLTKTKIK